MAGKPLQKRKRVITRRQETAVQADGNITELVAENVRRLRTDLQLSLEKLAEASGVSKAMLSQIEQARSAPSINVLWKIAAALDIPFAALLSRRYSNPVAVIRRQEMKPLSSHTGEFVSRALFPLDSPRRVEFYELTLAPGCQEEAEAHPPGATENIAINAGELIISIDGETQHLKEGDSVFFQADSPHTYRNPGKATTRAYLVMTYAEKRI